MAIEIDMSSGKIDWDALARLVRDDRNGKSQTKYGQDIGLSQGQVSDLERKMMRELSAGVDRALRKRFKEIPEVGAGTRLADSPHRKMLSPELREASRLATQLLAIKAQNPDVYRQLANLIDAIAVPAAVEEIERKLTITETKRTKK
jgi:hypothetical protein